MFPQPLQNFINGYQYQGGAKNPVVILPEADVAMTTKSAADSAFGCAGQRCLAASLAITVGDSRNLFTEAIADAAQQRVVGYALDQQVQMGPLITPHSQARIQGLLAQGIAKGGSLLVDGCG
jgi:malonate-semialdehyde dehydrogenase (acetylating) / methylmalonate-semialdehyde dehydrogenase